MDSAREQVWTMGAQEDLDFWDAVFADSGMAVTYKAGGKANPQWTLQTSAGFNGTLASASAGIVLSLSGKTLQPITLSSDNAAGTATGKQMTVLTRNVWTKARWKESFHLQGDRYSWKYSHGRCFCYAAKGHVTVAELQFLSQPGSIACRSGDAW